VRTGCPILLVAKRRLHRRVREEQLRPRIEQRHRVLEVFDQRLEVGLLIDQLRSIGRRAAG
jgi:predicted protein tyrosine phosphatase